MSLLQAWIDRVKAIVNPQSSIAIGIADDGSGSSVDPGKPAPLRVDPVTGELLVKSSGSGGGGGGGTVDQGSAGLTSWKVVEDNSAAIKTAVESIDTKATADPATDTSVQAITTTLDTINTTLGSPLQAGGNVAVTSLPGSPAQTGDNMGANLRVASTAVSNSNPVPISDAGGSITVDGTVSISGTVTSTPSGTQNVAAANQAATAAFPVHETYDGTNFVASSTVGSGVAIPSGVPMKGAVMFVKTTGASTMQVVNGSTSGALHIVGQSSASAAVASINPVYVGINGGTGLVGLLGDSSGRPQVVQTGTDSSGTNRTATVTTSGSQIVAFDGSHTGPFGDLIAEGKTPVLSRHWSILNAFDPQQDETVTQANGATVAVSSQRLALTSGTTNAADACYRTIKTAQYRPGQGFVFRWTAAFTTGVANSTQELGFGNGTNGGGGNAIAVGYNGTSFGILHRNAGSSTWIAQSVWNGDKLNGTGTSGVTITTSNLNVFFAHVPYLGAGTIHLYAMLPNGTITRIHSIQYPNSSTSLEFSDPAFRFYGRVVSTGSTTNLVAYSGSAAAYTIGKIGHDGQQWAVNRTVNVNGTAPVLSIRCATSINGALNNTPLRIRSVSFTADNGNTTSTGICTIGATLGVSPSFAAFDGKSATTADNGVTLTSANTIGTVDIAATTVTGGDMIWNAATPRNSASSSGELEENPIFIWPGQTHTFYAVTGAATNVTYAINGTVG